MLSNARLEFEKYRSRYRLRPMKLKGELSSTHQPILFVTLFGMPLHALIDTGATHNTIFTSDNSDSNTFFERTGKIISLTAAGGHVLNCPEVLASITINEKVFHLKFALAFGSFNTDIILSANFLSECRMSLFICGSKFLLRDIPSNYFHRRILGC